MLQLPIFLLGTSVLLVALSPAAASSHGFPRHAVGIHARQEPVSSTGPGVSSTSVSETGVSTTTSSVTTSSSTTSIRTVSTTTTTSRTTTSTSTSSTPSITTTTRSTSSSSSETSSSITFESTTTSSSRRSSVTTASSASSSVTATSSTPVATFSLEGPVILPPSSSEEAPPAQTNVPLGRTGGAKKEEGFLQNKGAVAGTFTVVGLVVIASLILLISLVMRRRRAKKFDEDWFEKEIPDQRASSPSRSHSPGASITDLHTQAPMEASYGDPFRDYHHEVAPVSYGTTQQTPSAGYGYSHHNNSSYSADIPSNTYLQSHTQEAQRASPPQPPSSQMLPTLFQNNAVLYSTGPTLAAAQPSHARTLPVARGSYQPSVDSFYGGQAK